MYANITEPVQPHRLKNIEPGQAFLVENAHDRVYVKADENVVIVIYMGGTTPYVWTDLSYFDSVLITKVFPPGTIITFTTA